MGRFTSRIILNDPPQAAASPSIEETAENLQRGMLQALGAYMTSEGRVDYTSLSASAEFREAVECSRRLPHLDLAPLRTRPARLAFWINVYNALILHAIITLGVRRTMWELWNFFSRVSYRIGGFTISADGIEHGILRGNRRRLFPPLRPFPHQDPRLALAVHPIDPRFHFAITCGARSCPPVGVYRAATIDNQLDLATRNFVNQEIVLDTQGRIACSKIFKWYRDDFESTGTLANFLLQYLDGGPVREAIAAGETPCRTFRPYRWGLQYPPVK